MKTTLEKRIILAEADGVGPDAGGIRMLGRELAWETWFASALMFGNTIDSIQAVVLKQSDEFQREFASKLKALAIEKGLFFYEGGKYPCVVLFHQLIVSDWRDCFVETVKQRRKK